MFDLTVLCKVVDNYGDIGFVYRLCRSVSELTDDIKIRLVVSNLESFSAIANEINPTLPVQIFKNWKVFDWNNAEICKNEFQKEPPFFLLECFQCERPNWLEEIIFAPDFKNTVHALDIEYLTAEDWAEDFHLIKSGTRSINVKKNIFMPGFTSKTGGLLFDKSFMDSKNSKENALKKLTGTNITVSENDFNILIFSYLSNFDFLVKAINKFSKTKNIKVFIAAGICAQSFFESCNKQEILFQTEKLPYIEQEKWDALLTLMDFSFVRGEDSFSRVCLCGKPFVWHIYKQEKDYHLVKLEAFHQKLCAGKDYERFSFLYNSTPQEQTELEELAFKLLSNSNILLPTFQEFSDKLISNGSMERHLLEFLSSLI